MGSLAESSSLQTFKMMKSIVSELFLYSLCFFLFRLLLPCACSPLLPVKLKQVLMLVFSMATMDTDTILAMPTMVTMDTHMPTIMDITMARGLLMPSLRPMLVFSMVTMDTHMPTITVTSTARGLLMPSPLLMLPMDTMVTHTTMDMPTMDIMDTLMPTMDTIDIIIRLFVKN